MKKILLPILWILIVFFGYKLFNSVYEPIQFNKVKTERYADVIRSLKDIGNAQVAHKSVTGFYAQDFKSLVEFIDTAQYVIIEKRDSSYLEYDRTYRIDMLREVQIVDTLGFAPVKDSLFGNSNHYKNMAKVPVKGVDTSFSMKADIIDKNGYQVPVFEVRIAKDIVLHDQNAYLLEQEKATISVDGVNGPAIILGSLSEVSTNGNWPTIYDAGTQQ
ncbi:MAG: hypothetical protein O2810_00105 [Bacteroidetes bacterium]|nr:hypothetical protein [Bacteroidota bacterium]MDA0887967.1 hypothetical protein [Bacteroidota bacterium]MDA1083921.1 hypothetical protein [Bacteroidota bacterium]